VKKWDQRNRQGANGKTVPLVEKKRKENAPERRRKITISNLIRAADFSKRKLIIT